MLIARVSSIALAKIVINVTRHVKVSTDDLAKSLASEIEHEADECTTKCESGKLSGFFFFQLCMPIVQILVITHVRLLDGYGYFESLYLTVTERHVAAYLAVVKSSAMDKANFIWLFL